MDKEQKLFLGKMLGEIYRMERANDNVACHVRSAHIYALLNGFEHAIDRELEMIGYVSKEKLKAVMDVLDPIWADRERLEKFKGFYDIERKLSAKGVDRGDAIAILTYLKANGQFTEIIDKMDSSHSPTECRTFELSDWDV
ncbi:MAG: hypothetical protein ABFS45_16175 [Pseudomonadota bacterium]